MFPRCPGERPGQPKVLSQGPYHRHKSWVTLREVLANPAPPRVLLSRQGRIADNHSHFTWALDTQVPQTDTDDDDDETSLRAERQQLDIGIKGKMYVQI